MPTVVVMQSMALVMAATTRRKTRFPTAVTPNAMLCMTTTAATVQKAAFGRSKSPPLAVKKQQLVGPSPALTMGWKFILVVFKEVMITLLFLNKAGMGPLFGFFPSPWGRLGWGLWLMVRTPGNSVGVAIS